MAPIFHKEWSSKQRRFAEAFSDLALKISVTPTIYYLLGSHRLSRVQEEGIRCVPLERYQRWDSLSVSEVSFVAVF